VDALWLIDDVYVQNALRQNCGEYLVIKAGLAVVRPARRALAVV